MNYQEAAMQANPYAEKIAASLAREAQRGAMLGAQQDRDKKPIEAGMESMERAVAGIEATVSALDGRLGLVKRNGAGIEGSSSKEANAISNNRPLTLYMQDMTKRLNNAQRRIAELCSALEI